VIITETRLKGWGNSIGIVLPKKELKKEGLDIDDVVEVKIRPKVNPLREAWGMLNGVKPRSGRSTRAVLKELDKEFSKYD